jgi:hypothetical protein
MIVYAIAIVSFLGAAVVLVVLLHRLLVAEDARYGAGAEQAPVAGPTPQPRQPLDRAA